MTDYPMIFNTDSVRAILAGKKTQTRRLITQSNGKMERGNKIRTVWPTIDWASAYNLAIPQTTSKSWANRQRPSKTTERASCRTLVVQTALNFCSFVTCRLDIDDRIWVRETFGRDRANQICYRADGEERASHWKSPIYLQRKHSRIKLVVEAIKGQRLQLLTREDALAEGMHADGDPRYPDEVHLIWSGRHPHPRDRNKALGTPRFAFGNIWNEMQRPPYSWAYDPWVWAISFRVEEMEDRKL